MDEFMKQKWRLLVKVIVLLGILLLVRLTPSAVEVKRGKWFDRIYIIVYDKADFTEVSKDINFAKWARRGKLLDNYWSVGFGSQSNYISMIAGETLNIYDETSQNLQDPNIIDRLQPDFTPLISWKAYLEDYTGGCNANDKIGRCNSSDTGTSYVRAHNPFISFDDIRSTPERCARIVPATELAKDVGQNTVPKFNFYVPNKCHNGEGTNGVGGAGKHLNELLIKISSVSDRTLVVVTFASLISNKPDRVFTALIPLGQMDIIRPGSRDNTTEFDHYSLLRTVEDNWDLRHLEECDSTAKNFFYDQNSASIGFQYSIRRPCGVRVN